MITTPAKTSTQLMRGPAGKLEVVVLEPVGEQRNALGVVCHPHPLFGGTMENKVVTTLAKTFQYLGITTVRFNFRGVGKSEGTYDHGHGELLDLLAVIEWMQQAQPHQALWLGGFSFGSYIAAKAATQIQTKQLVTIAPPVQHFPMHLLPPILCPWVLVQGEKDDIVPPQEVFNWVERREPKPIVLKFPEADHFFHGQLGELRTRLEAVLGK
jgi:alpha/beta superfamily hydrolase